MRRMENNNEDVVILNGKGGRIGWSLREGQCYKTNVLQPIDVLFDDIVQRWQDLIILPSFFAPNYVKVI